MFKKKQLIKDFENAVNKGNRINLDRVDQIVSDSYYSKIANSENTFELEQAALNHMIDYAKQLIIDPYNKPLLDHEGLRKLTCRPSWSIFNSPAKQDIEHQLKTQFISTCLDRMDKFESMEAARTFLDIQLQKHPRTITYSDFQAEPRFANRYAGKLSEPSYAPGLRTTPVIISVHDMEAFDLLFNGNLGGYAPVMYIDNQYKDNCDGTITDHATGLMWQKSGYDDQKKQLPYSEASAYIKQLNSDKFAGHTGWRLPTVPELTTLLEPEQNRDNLYISELFNPVQNWVWSCDEYEKNRPYYISFFTGCVDWYPTVQFCFVRGVRSVK